jgi:cytochrome P450
METKSSVVQEHPTKNTPIVKGLPLIGNMIDFSKDPVATMYDNWKQAGDVYNLNIGPRLFCVVSDPRLANEILIEKKHIFQRAKMVKGGTPLAYMLGTSVLTIDGDLWLSKRRMLQPIFHRQRLQGMAEQMAAGGAQMLTRWEDLPDGQAINLGEEMKLVTLDIINRTMFSVNVLPEVDRIGQSVDIGLHYISDRTRMLIPIPDSWPTPANLTFKRALASLDEFLYRVIAERRASSAHPGDLLDMLLEARDEDTGEGMNDEQVRNEVASIYGAGHETTAVALSWTWYALNQHPQILAKLQQELDRVLQGRQPDASDLPSLPYTQAIFEETLRVFPPVPLTVRTAEQDTRVGEYEFPKGTLTAISIYNIHNHPAYWEEPQSFSPERFLPENKARLNRLAYIPFLTGPHQCIGNSFSLMEGTLLLAMMAQRYELKLVAGQEITRDVAITMRPKGGLRMQVLRRA